MILDKNATKKVKVLTDDQYIEMFEQSVELLTLNDRLAKKIIIRDLVRKKISNGHIADMFADAEMEINDWIPKLTGVMAKSFSKVKFMKKLAEFNSNSGSKI